MLTYRDQELFLEDMSLTKVAEKYGTPCYVYSKAQLKANWDAFKAALGDEPHQICYAVKANPTLAILQFFANQ